MEEKEIDEKKNTKRRKRNQKPNEDYSLLFLEKDGINFT